MSVSVFESGKEDQDYLTVDPKLEKLLRDDNKDEFVTLLRGHTQGSEDVSDLFYQTDPSKLLCFHRLLCSHRAIGCATALLAGETGLTVDLNAPTQTCLLIEGLPDGPTPLAIAAQTLCYDLTDLFIKHGAEPSLCGDEDRYIVSLLPLSRALDALCECKPVKDFPAAESVYKLFSLFCLHELKEPLDTIKLLASKTKQVTLAGVCCVEQWNLVKLAALLLVAWDKLVVDSNRARTCPIAQVIRMQHSLESDEEKREITKSMWDALTLLERSANLVEQYRTTSMVKDEVSPFEFLIDMKLPTERKLVFSADMDRLATEFQLGEKALLETRLVSPKSVITEHEAVSLEAVYQLLADVKLHTEQKCVFSADSDRTASKLRLGDKVLLDSALVEKMSSKSLISEPIYFTPRSPQTDIERGDPIFSDQLDVAMRLDDRNEFVKLINGPGSFDILDCKNLLLQSVRAKMFENDSANCVAAVIAGETDGLFNFCDLMDVTWPFLHIAAGLGNPKLTALFLECGFLADEVNGCGVWYPDREAALPLNMALDSISNHYRFRTWKDKKSAIDLVTLLCTSEFRNHLETVRLLLMNTSNVYNEVLLYLREGKMIQLAALLIVGCKELLPSSFVVQNVVSSRHFSTSSRQCEDIDPLESKGILSLIDIFEKIGHYIGVYVRLVQKKDDDHVMNEISWLLARAGTSDAQISKVVGDSPCRGGYLANNEMVLVREYQSIVKPYSGIKASPLKIFSKQAAPSMLSNQRGRSLHTSVLKVDMELDTFRSLANGLINALHRLHSPMGHVPIVAVLRKGIRCI